MIKRTRLLMLAALTVVACRAPKAASTDDTTASTRPVSSSDDPDKNVVGGSIPAGYTARADRAGAPMSGAKYAPSGDGWDLTTGPAHILYDTKNLGNGNFTASATFEQLEAPAHPEAYGIFIGGMHLDAPNIAYTYFEVRGTGELLVKLRDGVSTRDVVAWTASPDVPKQDASGKATYTLAATVTNDAIKFSVNGKQVASVSKVGLPTDGVVGIRVNHNLHVKVSPVTIKTP